MDKQISQPMLEGSGGNRQGLQIEAGEVVPSKNLSSKNKKNKGLLIGFIIATILCIILFIALLFSLFEGDDLCLSHQCLRTASTLLQSMDHSVDPCDNFYKYTCGRWKDEHLVRTGSQKISWYSERGDLMDQTIKDFLTKEDEEDEPSSVHKARAMYRSCLDIDYMDEEGLQFLTKILKKIGFSDKPPIYAKSYWDWMGNVAKARKFLDMQILIGFSLSKLPTNRTINKLSLSIPQTQEIISLKSKVKNKILQNNEEDDDDEEEQERKKLMIQETAEFLKYFYLVDDQEITKDRETRLLKAADDIIKLHAAMSTIKKETEKIQDKLIPDSMTIYELQKLVDDAVPTRSKIRWLDYFDKLYSNTSVKDVKSGLENNETVLVFQEQYYIKLSKVLSKFSDRQIGLFVWWKIVYGLALNVNSNLIEFRKAVDLAAGYEHVTREEYCVLTITTVMKPALYFMITKIPNLEEKYARVEEMILNIKEAFISLVQKLKWMDEITKSKTIDKVEAMEVVIAYPDWINDVENFNDFYENVTVKEETHLNNLLQTFEEDAKLELQSLREIDDSVGEGLDPLDINAFYIQQENLIYVPVMILQFPFYNLGMEALNYGSIGVILGHEVTHGFDNTGRFYDKEGNFFEWWSEESDKEYKERVQCYIDRFGSFHIESVNKSVDGNLTLGENLADSGGLIEGFLAYKKYVQLYGEEPKLPNFENYTHEQLFFLSYAHTWCAEYESDDGILSDLNDEHSPEFVRTFVTLQESEEFSQVWNCPKGSNMNPEKRKCKLWYDEK